MMFRPKDDGKIRIRCPECGKKLKFPAGNPGLILRCPICMNTVVAPLDGAAEEQPQAEPQVETQPEPQKQEAEAKQEAGVYPLRAGTGGKLVEKIQSYTAQSAEKRRNESITRIMIFLNSENDRMRSIAVDVIHNPDMPAEQKRRRLLSLRQEKNTRTRNEIDKIVQDLDDEIHGFTHHPTPQQATIRNKLRLKQEEKTGFLVFLKLMFGLKLADTHQEKITEE